MRFSEEEREDIKRELAALWDLNGTWRGEAARSVCINKSLFVSYAGGVEGGTIKHYSGPRSLHEIPTQRSSSENLERGYARVNAQHIDDIEDLDERARAMWAANSNYKGRSVRDEFLNVKLLASYLKALDSGARHIINPTNG